MSEATPGMVVVGGSIAGLTTVQELRRRGYKALITVVDRDHHAPYRRPDVSKALLHEAAGERTLLKWDDELMAKVLAPAAATAVDVHARVVTVATEDGEYMHLPYEKLVIATGAVARTLAFGNSSARVYSLRSLPDADRFRLSLGDAARLTIIGGGLIGLEVAVGLATRGLDVTVVELEKTPLGHVLGALVAERLEKMLTARGVKFILGQTVADIQGDGMNPVTVTLANGTVIESDLVLVAVGARPETTWLTEAGVDIADGVLCDEHGHVVGVSDVFAVGDVASWPNLTLGCRTRVEHWSNAIEQAVHVAKRVVGEDTGDGFRSLPYFWSDQADLKLQVLGSTACHDEVTIVREDEKSFLAEYRRGGRLVAVGGVNAGREVMTRRNELIEEFASAEASFGAAG